MKLKIGSFEMSFGADKQAASPTQPSSMVYHGDIAYGHSYPIVSKVWDGEKTLGELGVVVRNVPDFQKLRLRSYDAYAKIDTVKIIASKFFYWTVGSGLKLQAEPNRTVLQSEGIKNTDVAYADFQKVVEARFMIYANSKHCDYLKEKTLHELALDAYQGEFLGGDMLAIARFGDNGPNLQIISGEHVRNPGLDGDFYAKAEAAGNYIQHGIEIDKKGAHVAYFISTVVQKDGILSIDGISNFERIPAIGAKTGKRLAWMISGEKISPDHLRSVPAMSQSLEKINKLSRYEEAAVTKAEQAAKIVYAIEHEEYSTGESHLDSVIAQKRNPGVVAANGDEPNAKVLADGLANRMTETSGGVTYNMPQGAALKSFGTDIETSFADFHGTIFKSISAGVDVPPEVAMQSYNSNYSASRAAINSFGYIISVKREKFANKLYVPFYKLWMEYEILTNKISAPGYMENITNFMVTDSYTNCKFTGNNMPHIDPLKEAKSIELMLNLKLISREQAAEMMGVGEWSENFMKSLEEEKKIPKEAVVETETSKNKGNAK